MSSILRGLAAEITPDWMKPKAADPHPDPREEPTDKPMPAPTWEPDVERNPLDPNEEPDQSDKDDPRQGVTRKPE